MLQRLFKVLRFIDVYLAEFKPSVTVMEHYIAEPIEYLNVKVVVRTPLSLIVIREYVVQENVVAYGYYARIGDHEEWWNNRPHHPEVETHPHHIHVKGGVKPLHSPDLEAFLKYIKKRLLK
jgi:hypothetical protein